MADLRIVDAPLLSTVKGTEKIPTGGEGNFSVSIDQVADFSKLKWVLATEGYVDNAVGNVQADLNLHKNNVINPHQVTKLQVGLGNVDNTADLDKPVSNATQSAIITANSGKADKIYVDTQNNLKADKVSVEASLLLKADKVDLTASKVSSDGNQTQQAINDFGGAKWYAKSGGYGLGATVKLDNGDTVRSTESANTVNPNVDMAGWVNITKLGQIIDTRLHGVVANTVFDMTPWIKDAIDKNPTARKFYLPQGEILCNIVLSRSYMSFIGQGLGVTKLIGFDKTKPTIDYAKRLYVHLEAMSVNHRHDATASIVNARDSRYLSTHQVEIYQLPSPSDVFTYSVRGFDLRPDTVYWTGYNYFKESRFNRCMYGVEAGGAPLSATSFDDCIISFNGYFGAKLDGIVGGHMSNCDIATNGQIGIRDGVVDETLYGGVWVKGTNFKIDGAWHELNCGKFGFPTNSDYPNDVYIHPDSVNVTEVNPRRQRSSSGGYLATESQASQSSNGYSDVVLDTGMGAAKHQNLLSNGNFNYSITNWLNANVIGSDYSIVTNDCPKGFERVLQLNSAGGVKSLYQKIYESSQTGNTIDNLAQHIGKTISITCWVKNIGAAISDVRIGFDTAAIGTNVYFSTGSFINNTPLNKWVKVVLTHKIVGTEGRLFAGIRTVGNVLVCGFNSQLGSRVADYEPKRITEEGGKILGELDAVSLKKGGVSVATTTDISNAIQVRAASQANLASSTSSVNVDKRHPSFCFNTSTGKMYFTTGLLASSAWRSTDGTGDITPV